MATTFWQRLFGAPPDIPAKAATGAGVFALTWDTHVDTLSRNPQKLARQAQALYRSHSYIHAAESGIVNRAAGVGWHLEDDQGNTLDAHPFLDLQPSARQFGPIPQVAWQKMRRLTLRHAGLCGYSFWYLDGLAAGIPSQLLYINPSRMVAAEDKAGNLIGWIMDPDRPDGRQPVPFTVDEILPFIFDPDDDGHLGVGLVESAITKVRLTEKTDWHAIKSVAAGGRKPGIIMPSAEKGAFTDDEYNAVVRELRNVTDSPDAAKKSLIFKARVDYTDAGTTAEELQLADVMKLGREDIYGHWGYPMSQNGYSGPTGMNSGEARKYDEAEVWQGPVQARLDMWQQTIQGGLLDRYAAIGLPATLELHTPTFDDKKPAFDIAQTAAEQPLTRNERRALVGLPPLPDVDGAGAPLGTVIDLPATIVQVAVVPPESDTSGDMEEGGDIKAKADLRSRMTVTWEPRLRRVVAGLLREQRDAITAAIEEHGSHVLAKPTDSGAWWKEARWVRRFAEELGVPEEELARAVTNRIGSTVRRPGKAGFTEGVLDFVKRRATERIAGILQTTREAISGLIADAVKAETPLDELVRSIRGATAFDDARAETIARTETAYAYSDAAIGSYRALDVGEVDVIDGDGDEVCAAANGSRWTLEEAEADPLGHPNCTRDFIPVV